MISSMAIPTMVEEPAENVCGFCLRTSESWTFFKVSKSFWPNVLLLVKWILDQNLVGEYTLFNIKSFYQIFLILFKFSDPLAPTLYSFHSTFSYFGRLFIIVNDLLTHFRVQNNFFRERFPNNCWEKVNLFEGSLLILGELNFWKFSALMNFTTKKNSNV